VDDNDLAELERLTEAALADRSWTRHAAYTDHGLRAAKELIIDHMPKVVQEINRLRAQQTAAGSQPAEMTE
jgi:hypothetical protein